MKFVRQLDGHTKLFAAFAVIVCFGGLLALWQLHEFDRLGRLAASGAAAAPFEQFGAGVAAARLWTGCLLATEALLAVLLALWLAAELERPLQAAGALAVRLASGELGRSATPDASASGGHPHPLLHPLRGLHGKLVGMMVQLRGSAETIAGACADIADGSGELSQSTKRQLGALEDAATSMRQLTAGVKRNADRADRARKLATAASAVALRAGEAVGAVVGTMSSINNASRQITEIVGVIDALAFQTNILALNAAVEAARAGEQGRGFAVVAAEVRLLAQRSADAAREIKVLIADSVEKVRAGGALADRAGGTMREVVAGVKRVSDIIAEIAQASTEQASGIDQANQAVKQVDRSTWQNAALLERSAAAAAALQAQVGDLGRIIGTFTLAPEPARPTAALRLIVSNPDLPTPRSGARPRAYLRIAAAPAGPAASRRAGSLPAPECDQ